MSRRPFLLAVLLASLAAVAGCAPTGGEGGRPERDVRLVLDFTPNAVHAGIYLAVERGYDQAEGITLRVEPPSSSTDNIKLLRADRVDAAILDIHDLAIADEKDPDLVAVAALEQTPLAAVLAQPGIARPRDLEGRTAGVTGLPSDDAVLDSIVAGDGGDPAKVKRTTIGFTAVPALLGRRVWAATAFWNVEGLAVKERRPGIHEFRVNNYGAPEYPELVLVMRRTLLDEDPDVARALVRALRTGYERTVDDPPAAASALMDGVDGLNRNVVDAQLDAITPELIGAGERWGAFDRARMAAWAAWEQEFGIVKRRPDIDRLFAFDVSAVGD